MKPMFAYFTAAEPVLDVYRVVVMSDTLLNGTVMVRTQYEPEPFPIESAAVTIFRRPGSEPSAYSNEMIVCPYYSHHQPWTEGEFKALFPRAYAYLDRHRDKLPQAPRGREWFDLFDTEGQDYAYAAGTNLIAATTEQETIYCDDGWYFDIYDHECKYDSVPIREFKEYDLLEYFLVQREIFHQLAQSRVAVHDDRAKMQRAVELYHKHFQIVEKYSGHPLLWRKKFLLDHRYGNLLDIKPDW